jgi:hypothetical protein
LESTGVVFSGRAGVRPQRLSADGQRLLLRASGWWDELLDPRGKPPLRLTAHRSHAAIFDVHIDETGAVTAPRPAAGYSPLSCPARTWPVRSRCRGCGRAVCTPLDRLRRRSTAS